MSAKRARGAEEVKRRKLARIRMKRLIRSVILNRLWLSDAEDNKIALNVQRNIDILVRPKTKFGVLSMEEKAAIRTPHSLRTVTERKLLVKLISNLLCFAMVPPKIRARLVPVIKFMYLQKHRILMREGDPPSMVYFVLSGEIEISNIVFDPASNAYVHKVVYILGPGDIAGELEIIEGCKRLNTFVASTPVELLVLYREDFCELLQPHMAKQWEEKKLILKSMSYFDHLTPQQAIVTCKLGKIQQFDPLETIHSGDKGMLSYVYFVLSGECMILQCLKMKVKKIKKTTKYELVEIETGNNINEELIEFDHLQIIKRLKERDMLNNKLNVELDFSLSSEDEHDQKHRRTTTEDLKTVEISCGLRKQSSSSESDFYDEDNDEDVEHGYGVEHDDGDKYDDNDENEDDEGESEGEVGEEEEETNEISRNNSRSVRDSLKWSTAVVDERRPLRRTRTHADSIKSNKSNATPRGSYGTSLYNSLAESKSSSIYSKKIRPTKIENRFIDVGSLTFGGIFSLGEKSEHRFIMARTTVQCFLLPRYWLFAKEQNPNKYWQRKRIHLEFNIPSREALFEDFLSTRRWQKFKEDLIQSEVETLVGCPTKIQDVPVISRLIESIEP